MAETKRSSAHNEPSGGKTEGKRPWPLSWVFIAILAYILLQTLYFLLNG